MNSSDGELVKTVIIPNQLGIHARPAGMIANLAKNAKFGIQIIKNGKQVDASSIIDILSLLCEQGTLLTLKTDSLADKKILNDIVELIKKGFNE